MTNITFTEAELKAIEILSEYALPEGTRCPVCHRRRNKKLKEDSPAVREVRFRGPTDLVEVLEEGMDALQEFSGIDPYSYPRARLLEALLALGAAQREEIKAHFEGRE